MSRYLEDALVRLPRAVAAQYFRDSAADIKARMIMSSLAGKLYFGPGMSEENEAVAILMHACYYLEDRIGYEMDPAPRGMVKIEVVEMSA